MSSIIERDVSRLVTAATNCGITNIETFKRRRWLFHLTGKIAGRTILMAFDPTHRPVGGTPKERDRKAWKDKQDWAEKEDFLFYVPRRTDDTITMEFKLKQWLNQHGLLNL